LAKFATGHRYFVAFARNHQKIVSLLKDTGKPDPFAQRHRRQYFNQFNWKAMENDNRNLPALSSATALPPRGTIAREQAAAILPGGRPLPAVATLAVQQ